MSEEFERNLLRLGVGALIVYALFAWFRLTSNRYSVSPMGAHDAVLLDGMSGKTWKWVGDTWLLMEHDLRQDLITHERPDEPPE